MSAFRIPVAAHATTLATLLWTSLGAQAPQPLPLRQSALDAKTSKIPLTLEDVSQPDRWFGVGVSQVRWAPDGSGLYVRWPERPGTADDSLADSWWRVDRDGGAATPVPPTDVWQIPADDIVWSSDGRLAAWTRAGRVYLWSAAGEGAIRAVAEGPTPPRNVAWAQDGTAVDYMVGEDLYRYDAATGTQRRLTRVVHPPKEPETAARRWLAQEQRDLFDAIREDQRRERQSRRDARLRDQAPQAIPVAEGTTVDDVVLSPNGRFVTFRATSGAEDRPRTLYMDYVTTSGYAESKEARGKVGEPRATERLGIVSVDPRTDPDSVVVRWVELPEAQSRPTTIFGPYWSLEGDRAVVEAITRDDKDLWIALLDLASGTTTVIDHQHDDAWIGGPPVQSNYGAPGLLEWLPGGRLVFASEKTGWSHLYLAEPGGGEGGGGGARPLTTGDWEVRGASLSRNRSTWLIRGSREHAADDHLYTLPATGGQLVQLTTEQGRSDGILSPDGRRLAVVHSRNDALPDLFLRDPAPGATAIRVTVSGTDQYWRHAWRTPEIVTFPHPDGGPLWAALYRPARRDPKRPGVIYVHGGGYRQFAQRGWSVYGYSHASHYGMINYLVQQGYTVLDFDYRGSAGYGRDYRTDIYRSMGAKDVEGAVAAARWLVHHEGVDSTRIGIYGVSYGGFLTLMSLFRHPGIFVAGVSAAGVTDWAHYNDSWTSRILNLPSEDPEAYRGSSPIYYADGLRDHLLIEHGLVDPNVEFQDAARLVQRLLELHKDFEVIYYPREPHVIEGTPALYDFHQRLTIFFTRYLLRPRSGEMPE